MTVELVDIGILSVGDVDVFAIDYTPYLDASETLASVSTPVELTSTDLTFANVAVNAAAVVIKGVTVAIGKAVQFKVSGQQLDSGSPKLYRVKVTAITNSSPARTKVVNVKFRCI